MRVGIGYDVHRLVAGRKLVLAGFQPVSCSKGQDHYRDVLAKIKQHEINVFSELTNKEKDLFDV